MKKFLAFSCAVLMLAVLCACENVLSSQPDSSATDLTEEVTEQTEQATNAITEEQSETEEPATQAEITTPTDTDSDTTEPISLDEEKVKALTYGDWTQSNANSKTEKVRRIVMYIESKGDEVALNSNEIVAQLNSLETASDTDSLVTLTYEILGIEEK